MARTFDRRLVVPPLKSLKDNNMPSVDHPTPRTQTSGPVRLIGYSVLAFLMLAIILLALGVFNFKQAGSFK